MKAYIAKDLKNLNRRTVYQCIRNSSEQTVSCAQIARETHISMPTVVKITEYFVKKGLLLEIGESESNGVGRRPSMLKFNPNAFCSVGVAYNGKDLELSLINMNYEAVRSDRIRTSVTIGQMFSDLSPSALSAFLSAAGAGGEKIVGIGIALPVILDTANYKTDYPAPLIGIDSSYDFKAECDKISGYFNCPLYMENDVNAAALGEFKERGMTEKHDLIYITLGSGIGSGIILNGRLRRGENYAAGEIGYMTFDESYHVGKRSIGYLESCLSADFLQKKFGYNVYGDNHENDAETKIRVADQIATYLSLCILNMSSILDISNFVVGGFVVEQMKDLILKFTKEKIDNNGLNKINVLPEISSFPTSKGMGSIVIDKTLDNILMDGGMDE